MRTVEAALDLIDQICGIEIDVRQRNVHLEYLFAVAHLGRLLDLDRSGEPCAQPVRRLLLQPRKHVAHLGLRRRLACPVVGLTNLVPQIASEHAPSRQNRGFGRNYDTLDLELARHLGSVYSGSATKAKERETPRIDTAF